MGTISSVFDGRLTRRDLLRRLGRGGLAAAGLAALAGCRGSSTPDTPEPPPSVKVRVLAHFYNHTQGYIGDREYSGMSGSLLPIRIADSPEVSSVDPSRFSVRSASKGGWLGTRIEFSTTGQLNTALFPGQDAEYDVFLMNKTNGADYSLIDGNSGLVAGQTPIGTWDREDHWASGPDEIPHEAMRQINQALAFPWAKYMEFTELAPNVRGDIWVGYMIPESDPGATFRGAWSEGNAWVNPEVCPGDILKLRVFIEMIIGHIVSKEGFASNYASTPSYEYLTDPNGITPLGRDLLACAAVKEKKSAG